MIPPDRTRWLYAYVVIAMIVAFVLMSGALGRAVIGPGIAALTSAVAVLVAVGAGVSVGPAVAVAVAVSAGAAVGVGAGAAVHPTNAITSTAVRPNRIRPRVLLAASSSLNIASNS